MDAHNKRANVPKRYEVEKVQPDEGKGWLGERISLKDLAREPILTREIDHKTAKIIGLIVLGVAVIATFSYAYIFKDSKVIVFAYSNSLVFVLVLLGKIRWPKSQTKMFTESRSTSQRSRRSISKRCRNRRIAALKRRSSNRP